MTVAENNTVHYIIKKTTDFNNSLVFDVRTPPKIQNEIQQKLNLQHVESSHAGIAIPIDEDLETLEASTKKMNFYKIERPTTTKGGLSTWILLSGQASSTTSKPPTKKVSIKPVVVKEPVNNTVVISDKPMKIIKPIFKPRATTARPSTTSSTNAKTTTVKISSSTKTTTTKPIKLTKIKASLLNTNNKNNISLVNSTTTTTPAVTTIITTNSPTTVKTTKITKSKKPATTTTTPATTTILTTTTGLSTTSIKSDNLPAEAKEGEQELSSNDKKKEKDQKKKKNKIKKKKQDKNNKEPNNKLKEVESAGTQLYSYLRSEIIPVTVGVSLVGLLVTAGLASYYFQPFGAFSLRRNDPQDRKDTYGGYYYQDDYSNAVREEDAFGQVIAGMDLKPNNDNYKSSTKNPYQSDIRYRQVDRRSEMYMTPSPIKTYTTASGEYDHTYPNTNKFVVGSVIKEDIQEVTPAVVPEHGPRDLKVQPQKFIVGNSPDGASPRNLRLRRKKRQTDISPEENEIVNQETFDIGAILQMKNKGISDVNDEVSESYTKTTSISVS
ncbi:hypothetical protein GWI33_011529 [Rhynchophorus ferrugineus]|uniref:Uncharacterized protein n=1 Tax=Rhynchophorus ferrugineus TaxID=354439 RepID=A0A834IWI5_RHYFE|nr:hypothetical protein GWI33_011529 [Rhynchophorus ferrugineus]